MHKPHFAFKHHPFDNPLRSDELFDSDATREARSRIRHLPDLRGIGLPTGEAGSGKTALCRQAVARLHPNRHRVCHVALSTGSVLESCNMAAAAFGLERFTSRSAACQAIRNAVSRLVAGSRQHPVPIFDEAHRLHNEILEESRLLANCRMDSGNRLCLLLARLAELRRRLEMAAHASLSQRIVLRCTLEGLGRDEVGPCITHRLRLAGSDVEIFEEQAVEAVALASNGLPGRIDRIAHCALHARPPSTAPGRSRSIMWKTPPGNRRHEPARHGTGRQGSAPLHPSGSPNTSDAGATPMTGRAGNARAPRSASPGESSATISGAGAAAVQSISRSMPPAAPFRAALDPPGTDRAGTRRHHARAETGTPATGANAA